jgi:signal transduction histidine kinase
MNREPTDRPRPVLESLSFQGREDVNVADSGGGMPADRLATIFERFARLDEGRSRDWGGLGLGLAIVKAIVQAHGGTVQVKSAVGTGSAFEILLPLQPSPDPAGAHQGVVAGPRLQGTWLHG